MKKYILSTVFALILLVGGVSTAHASYDVSLVGSEIHVVNILPANGSAYIYNIASPNIRTGKDGFGTMWFFDSSVSGTTEGTYKAFFVATNACEGLSLSQCSAIANNSLDFYVQGGVVLLANPFAPTSADLSDPSQVKTAIMARASAFAVSAGTILLWGLGITFSLAIVALIVRKVMQAKYV